jgi:hypothetical protein
LSVYIQTGIHCPKNVLLPLNHFIFLYILKATLQ